MKLYIRPRRSGKTTELCQLAQDLDMFNYNVWIIACNQWNKLHLQTIIGDKVDQSNIKFLTQGHITKDILRLSPPPDHILCDEWLQFEQTNRKLLVQNYNDKIIGWATPPA